MSATMWTCRNLGCGLTYMGGKQHCCSAHQAHQALPPSPAIPAGLHAEPAHDMQAWMMCQGFKARSHHVLLDVWSDHAHTKRCNAQAWQDSASASASTPPSPQILDERKASPTRRILRGQARRRSQTMSWAIADGSLWQPWQQQTWQALPKSLSSTVAVITRCLRRLPPP